MFHTLRLITDEGVDAAPVASGMGVPHAGVGAQCSERGMKRYRRVHVVVVALGGVDWLRAAHLLRGLAHELQAPGDIVALHRRLGGQYPGQGGDAEGGMRIGVAGRGMMGAVPELAPGHAVLVVAGHGVILGIGSDGRPAAVRPARAEGGRHAAGAFLDLDSLPLQAVHIPCRRPVFAPRRFVKDPDHAMPVRECPAVGFDPVDGRLLFRCHVCRSACISRPARLPRAYHRRPCEAPKAIPDIDQSRPGAMLESVTGGRIAPTRPVFAMRGLRPPCREVESRAVRLVCSAGPGVMPVRMAGPGLQPLIGYTTQGSASVVAVMPKPPVSDL